MVGEWEERGSLDERCDQNVEAMTLFQSMPVKKKIKKIM